MITFPVCQDKFRYVTLPASEMGKDYEAQIYIGTGVVNAVLSAVISLYSPLKFAINGMTRFTPVTLLVHAQRGNYCKLLEVSIVRMERWR